MIAPFVDAEWLAEHQQDVVLVDVRWPEGRPAYDRGHLPGAVYVDLDTWLAAPPSAEAGRHPLPDPEVFATGMTEAGIGDGDTVVAYDDAGGVMAARLVWMLRALGQPAALLDGGLTAWAGRLETDPATRARSVFTPRPWPADRLADITDAAAAAVLLDARPADRFRGEVESPLDPRRGHIPGARSLPCRENVGETGRLLPLPELRERLAAVGVEEAGDWVSSCGSGVTSCHTLLVAEQLGLAPGRLYVGSWSQWAETDRPTETGPARQ